MDATWTSWLSDELEWEDYNLMDQCDIDDDHPTLAFSGFDYQENFHNQRCLSSASFSSYPTLTNAGNTLPDPNNTTSTDETCSGDFNMERPSKQPKTASNSNNNINTASSGSNNTEQYYVVSPQRPTISDPDHDPDSPSFYILSFEKSDSPPPPTAADITNHKRQPYGYRECSPPVHLKQNDKSSSSKSKGPSSLENKTHEEPNVRVTQDTKKSKTTARSPTHAQDHIMAERMRREKLTQRFIALSALIPGLKKIDKASVLADAIKYVKQLQEHVKVLEDQKSQSKKRSVESVLFVKKSQLSSPDQDDMVSSVVPESTACSNTSSDDDGHGNSDESLPEVEARVSDKDVLIRIHCEKHKGIFMNVLKEIENLSLSVLNSSVLPFGSSILDITIIAQMDDGYSLTVKELANNLRQAIFNFM
ncbi:transcription factor bHLH18-like [Quillaja saponaria]|uniref:Transcription factor bHLH18-like n=1 Tax=Quillaja saponaria TaxID=32244 RepID=A0AAD7L6T7_QUISA|nr:transcription factor bHLH18-like [Quillaja saponaria]